MERTFFTPSLERAVWLRKVTGRLWEKEVDVNPSTGSWGMHWQMSYPDCPQWFQVGFDWISSNEGKRDMHLPGCFAKCKEHQHHHHLFLLHFKQTFLLGKVTVLTFTALVSNSQKGYYLTQRLMLDFWQEWEFRRIPVFSFSTKLNPRQSGGT